MPALSPEDEWSPSLGLGAQMGSSPAGTSVLLSPEPLQPVTVQTQCPPSARASHSWDPAIGAAALSCVPRAPRPSPALPKTPALVSSHPELCWCFSPLTSASRPSRPSTSAPWHLEHIRKRPPRKCIKAGVLKSPPPAPRKAPEPATPQASLAALASSAPENRRGKLPPRSQGGPDPEARKEHSRTARNRTSEPGG